MFQQPFSANTPFATLGANTHNQNGLVLNQSTFLNMLGFHQHASAMIGTHDWKYLQ